MNDLGQINGDVVGAVTTLIVLATAMTVGLLVVGSLEESTIGDCTEEYATVTNSTDLTASNPSTLFDLPSLITGDLAEDGNLTVAYDSGVVFNATINGHLLGEVSGTPPDTFSVNADYFSNPSNVSYSSSASDWNVTETNLTYYKLSSCDYTADAYSAQGGVYNMTYTGFNIMPIVILLFAAVAVIGAVLAFRRV